MLVHNTTSTEALNSIAMPHSPSSGSNSGSNFTQQLSPNERGVTATTTLSNGTATVTATVAATTVNNINNSTTNTTTTTAQQSNQQITLSTANLIAVNSLAVSSPPHQNSHALLSTHNPNKLLKLTNADCFDGVLGVVGTKASGKNLIITSIANGINGNGNIIVSAAGATIPTIVSSNDENANGAKINLPLQLLTPATSPDGKLPKQHTPQIHHHHHQHQHSKNTSNTNNNNNNESSLPLTPISPLNKTFNGTLTASNTETSALFMEGARSVNNHNNNNSSNNINHNNNNNNVTSPNLNHHGLLANPITADGSMTEDT